MRRPVRLSPDAQGDISRLIDFLAERDERAPLKARAVLERALMSLAEFPERAHMVDPNLDIRELRVKFGRYGYAIQYRVDEDAVFVANIFHVLEQR